MKIGPDTEAVVGYRLFDEEKQLIESGDGDEAMRFVTGHEEIFPSVEAALQGKEPGERVTVALEPDEAFGSYDPAGILGVPRGDLPKDHEYQRGDWVTIVVTQDGGESDELEARVLEVHETEVVLDANHPLAGQRVTFELEVESVHAAPDR